MSATVTSYDPITTVKIGDGRPFQYQHFDTLRRFRHGQIQFAPSAQHGQAGQGPFHQLGAFPPSKA